VSFIFGMLQGYLNADAQIMQDQRQYEQEQEEKKRLAKIESDKATLAFNRELIQKNLSTQDTFSKIYLEGVRDNKLKYNDSFENIIAFNKQRISQGLPTLPVSKFLIPFEDAEKFNSVFGDLKFRNKYNGTVADASAYLGEVSAYAQDENFLKKLSEQRLRNKTRYNEFMNSITRNISIINQELFKSDSTGTTAFDTSIYPGLNTLTRFDRGENVPQIMIDQNNDKQLIIDHKEKMRSQTQFFAVVKGSKVGTKTVKPLNFVTKSEEDSANKIGNLIGSNVNPYHDFVKYHVGPQADMTFDDKKSIFLASVAIDQTVNDVESLDPDKQLYTITGEKASDLFNKIRNTSYKNTKFAVIALSPFMQGPTKAKVTQSPGIITTAAGVSKEDYLVSRVFGIDTEDAKKQTNKDFTFAAIEEHYNNNAEVIATFNSLEELVKEQPDNPAIYNLFKQKLKAFVSLDEGILGGIVKDFLGNEGVTNIDDNESASIGIKDRLTSGYVNVMEERIKNAQGENAKRIEALKISLAFKMAKADDPSGRLSNQDVEAQYVKLGQITDLKRDALAVIAQTKAQFQKKVDKYELLLQYGRGKDDATERDYRVIDAVFAYDHLRKQSEAHKLLVKNKEDQGQPESLEAGSVYKGTINKNPSNTFSFIDTTDPEPTEQFVYQIKDSANKIIKNKYVLSNGTIVDSKDLVLKNRK
jgi:hypothetical protein